MLVDGSLCRVWRARKGGGGRAAKSVVPARRACEAWFVGRLLCFEVGVEGGGLWVEGGGLGLRVVG